VILSESLSVPNTRITESMAQSQDLEVHGELGPARIRRQLEGVAQRCQHFTRIPLLVGYCYWWRPPGASELTLIRQ